MSMVINYDLPKRVSRTGRVGNTGCAISSFYDEQFDQGLSANLVKILTHVRNVWLEPLDFCASGNWRAICVQPVAYFSLF
jgi:superfamily II DNA/RNA helicase